MHYSALVDVVSLQLSFTCDPDVYPASHSGDLVVTCNATLDHPIDAIEYLTEEALLWTYNVDPYPVSNLSYLMVDADPPAVNSSSHQFTITMDRCAGDSRRDVVIEARMVVVMDYHSLYQKTTSVTIDSKI